MKLACVETLIALPTLYIIPIAKIIHDMLLQALRRMAVFNHMM